MQILNYKHTTVFYISYARLSYRLVGISPFCYKWRRVYRCLSLTSDLLICRYLVLYSYICIYLLHLYVLIIPMLRKIFVYTLTVFVSYKCIYVCLYMYIYIYISINNWLNSSTINKTQTTLCHTSITKKSKIVMSLIWVITLVLRITNISWYNTHPHILNTIAYIHLNIDLSLFTYFQTSPLTQPCLVLYINMTKHILHTTLTYTLI